MREEAASAIGAKYAELTKADDSDRQRKIEEILAAWQTLGWNFLSLELVPAMEDAAREANAQAFAQIEAAQQIPSGPQMRMTANIAIKPAFDAVNQEAVDYAQERAAEMVGKRLVDGILINNANAVWRIDEPTREWLRRQITEAFEDGMSPAELAKAIKGNYAFSKARANTIARTEIGNINARTHAAAAKRMGANMKQSFLSADHDVDDFCDLAAEAGKVPIDHDYGGGLLWPLYHPNCWCAISFYWDKSVV